MIEIKLTYATPEEAARAMYRLAGLNDSDINAAVSASASVAGAPAGSGGAQTVLSTADAAARTPRKRRTNAEMEADRLAAEAAAKPAVVAESPPAAAVEQAAAEQSAADSPPVEPPTAPLAEVPLEVLAEKLQNVARPALNQILLEAGQDVARAFLNDYGYKNIRDMPFDKIDDFAAKCSAEAVRLKQAKAA